MMHISVVMTLDSRALLSDKFDVCGFIHGLQGRHGGDEMKDDEEEDESQTIHGALKRGIAGTDEIESPRKRQRTGEGE